MPLGKGLQSLIPQQTVRKVIHEETGSRDRIWHIPVTNIIPNTTNFSYNTIGVAGYCQIFDSDVSFIACGKMNTIQNGFENVVINGYRSKIINSFFNYLTIFVKYS